MLVEKLTGSLYWWVELLESATVKQGMSFDNSEININSIGGQPINNSSLF